MPESNTRLYKRDTGENLYRRSMYTFWKRAAPPVSMDVFNAPSRENCTVRRERTNTPLQALLLLNETQYVEAARALAERVLREASPTPEARLTLLFRSRLFRRVQAASLDFHDERGTTDSIYRIQYDAVAIQSVVTEGLAPFLVAGVTIVSEQSGDCSCENRVNRYLRMLVSDARPPPWHSSSCLDHVSSRGEDATARLPCVELLRARAEGLQRRLEDLFAPSRDADDRAQQDRDGGADAEALEHARYGREDVELE